MDSTAKRYGHQASWHFRGTHLSCTIHLGQVCVLNEHLMLQIINWSESLAKDGPLKLCGQAPLPAIVLLPPLPGLGLL